MSEITVQPLELVGDDLAGEGKMALAEKLRLFEQCERGPPNMPLVEELRLVGSPEARHVDALVRRSPLSTAS